MRKGQLRDISQLVVLDRKAYQKYGENEVYFKQKINASNTHIFVVEENKKLSGFIVFEFMESNEIPKDFCELDVSLRTKWMHIIAFTTETNYKDIANDSKLLKAVEKFSQKLGYKIFGVPLSINHPFLKNDVFGFWQKNGYQKVGLIKWIASPKEMVDCYFYSKKI